MKRIPKVLILLFLCLLCVFAMAEEEEVPLSVPEEVKAVLQQNYDQYIILSSCYTDSNDVLETEVEDPDEIYAFLIQYEDKYTLSVVEKKDGHYHLTASNPAVQVNGILPDRLLLDIVEEPKSFEEMIMKGKLSYCYVIGETEYCVTADSVLGSSVWTIDNVFYNNGDSQYTLIWMPDVLCIREPERYKEIFGKCSEWSIPLLRQFTSPELSSFSMEELLKYLHYDDYASYIIDNTTVYSFNDKNGTAFETIEADEYIWCLFSLDTWKAVGHIQNDFSGFVQSSLTAPRIFGRSDECKVIIPDEAYRHYTSEEIQSAIDYLKKGYDDSSSGCILWRIEYDDRLCSEDLGDGLNGADEYEKVIAFYTDFSFIDYRYTFGFEDDYVEDWIVYLGQKGDGSWEIFARGRD